MSTYPLDLDDFDDPAGSALTGAGPRTLSQRLKDHNDAIEELEAKLGIGDALAADAVAGAKLTKNADGTTGWQAGGSGGVVAAVAYNPGDVVQYVRNSSSALFENMDEDHLKVTFTAPSPTVLVTLASLVYTPWDGNLGHFNFLQWNLRDADGDIAGTAQRVYGAHGNEPTDRCTATILVPDLVVGDEYTFFWGHRREPSTAAASPNDEVRTLMGNVCGAGIMVVEGVAADF